MPLPNLLSSLSRPARCWPSSPQSQTHVVIRVSDSPCPPSSLWRLPPFYPTTFRFLPSLNGVPLKATTCCRLWVSPRAELRISPLFNGFSVSSTRIVFPQH